MTTDDLLARAEKRLFATATDPYDDGDNPWATLVADLVAEVRALTARLDAAHAVIRKCDESLTFKVGTMDFQVAINMGYQLRPDGGFHAVIEWQIGDLPRQTRISEDIFVTAQEALDASERLARAYIRMANALGYDLESHDVSSN